MNLRPSTTRFRTDHSRRGRSIPRWVVLCALLVLLPTGCGRPLPPNVTTEEDFMRLHEENLERALNLPQYVPDILTAEELERNLGIVLADFNIRGRILEARRMRQEQWDQIKQRQEKSEQFSAAGRERQRQRLTADYNRIRELQTQVTPEQGRSKLLSQFQLLEQQRQEGLRRLEEEREQDRQRARDLLESLQN